MRFFITASLTLLLAASVSAESYAVFHCIYAAKDCVETPTPRSTADAAKLMRRAAQEKENFVGLVDAKGTTLQFFVDRPGRVWVEIPAPEKKGSYGKQLSADEAVRLIEGLSGDLAPQKERLKLEFQKW